MVKPKQQPPPEPAEESRQLAKVVRPSSLAPAPDTGLASCPTNLDLGTAWGKAMAVAAGSPGDMTVDERGTAEFTAIAYLLFPDEGIDPESGELRSFTRTVLFTKEGRTFRSTSEFAPHALKRVLALYSPEEWRTGIPFIITERRSRKTGRTYHDLRVRIDALNPEGETK